jgi:hypothetical protein
MRGASAASPQRSARPSSASSRSSAMPSAPWPERISPTSAPFVDSTGAPRGGNGPSTATGTSRRFSRPR